jgi:hypothetical protein
MTFTLDFQAFRVIIISLAATSQIGGTFIKRMILRNIFFHTTWLFTYTSRIDNDWKPRNVCNAQTRSSHFSRLENTETQRNLLLRRHSIQNIEELTFTQALDHYNSSDSRSFQQRYFYSGRHLFGLNLRAHHRPNVAFLCIGGEGNGLDKSVLLNSKHCSGDMLEIAKAIEDQYDVHLFALEHRYYGRSFPDFGESESPVSNANLIYLSSRQAISDISQFVASQALPKDTKWIAFGASYAGMLAAWARLKLPHQIAAAVSNSAPLQPVLNFAAYNDQVAKNWADPVLGGSPECLQIIQAGYEEMKQAAETAEGADTITTAFNICDSAYIHNQKNLRLFLGTPFGSFNMQNNDPACETPLCNVEKICAALIDEVRANFTNKANETLSMMHMYALSSVVQAQENDESNHCMHIEIDPIDPFDPEAQKLRSWLWQR